MDKPERLHLLESISSESLDAPHNASFVALAEVVPAAILTADVDGRVIYSNLELQRLLRGPVKELSGSGWRNIVHPDDVRGVARASYSALTGKREELLFRIIDVDDLRWLHGRFAPMWIGEKIAGLVAVFGDITEQREEEAQLAHQATHDFLTEIPNRLLLRDRLAQALGRHARVAGSLAVLFIDLDRFKGINDQHGHAVGDQVLIEVARRLLKAIRPTDTVARLGGDEFIIVAEGLDANGAQALAERILEHLQQPIDTRVGDLTVTAAVGATIVSTLASVDEVIHQSDAAMYRAKRLGPGSIELQELS